MNIHAYILGIIGILEVALAIWFLVKYKRTLAIVWFAIFVFGIAGWVLSNSLLYATLDYQFLADRLVWFFGVVLTGSFLLFCRYFPYSVTEEKKSDILYFLAPVLFFAFVIFVSKNFIITLDYNYNPPVFNFGPLFFLFPLFFFSYWFYSIYQLVIKFRKSDGIHRWQLRLLLWGVCLSFTFGAIFDVIFNWLKITGFEMIGSESTIFLLAFTTYIIFKRK